MLVIIVAGGEMLDNFAEKTAGFWMEETRQHEKPHSLSFSCSITRWAIFKRRLPENAVGFVGPFAGLHGARFIASARLRWKTIPYKSFQY